MKARMHVFPNDLGANCAKIVMLTSDADWETVMTSYDARNVLG